MFHGGVADYEPARSPRALAERSELVVSGRLETVRDGPVQHPDDVVPGHTLILSFLVEEVHRGSLPPGADGRVYLWLDAPVNLPARCFDRQLPRTKEALMYLVPYPVPGGELPPLNDRLAGRPLDQPLWQFTTPQGLLFDSDGGVSAPKGGGAHYPGATLDEFLPDRERFPSAESGDL